MIKNFIAITIGDIKGIGIQLLIDLIIKKKINNFILFTNYNIIKKYLNKNKIKIKIFDIRNKKNNILVNKYNILYIYSFNTKNNIENSYKSLVYSYKYTKQHNLKGIINLPINKEKIIKFIDSKFIGQTEFYQKLDNKKVSNMIFIYKKLIITTLTTHIEINKITKNLSKNNIIYNKIISLNNVLIDKLIIKKPKFIISGINPHASENSMFGNEEEKILIPQIKKVQKKNIYIKGPFSADSILNSTNLKKYNCFIFCYHDQALVAYKYISKNRGINFTGGLSILRTSPDHGTAYNLVGNKNVENKSLLNCFTFLKKSNVNS